MLKKNSSQHTFVFPGKQFQRPNMKFMYDHYSFKNKDVLYLTSLRNQTQMWSSLFFFFFLVCVFFSFCVDVLLFLWNTIKMYFLLFQKMIKKYVVHWHINIYTGQFSSDRMLIKLELKETWTRTHLLVSEVCNIIKLIACEKWDTCKKASLLW